MSDYLSSLAARSLRREAACEPRRAQMFEPRQETPGTPFARESHEGVHVSETFEAVAPPATHAEGDKPDLHAAPREAYTQEVSRTSASTPPLNTAPDREQIPAHQPSHTRPGEGVSVATRRPTHDVRPVAAARVASPPSVARVAEMQSPSHEPATDVWAGGGADTPPPKVASRRSSSTNIAPFKEPERTAAPAVETAEGQGARAGAVDEEDRERMSADVSRAAVERRAERLAPKGSTTVVTAETTAGSNSEQHKAAASTEVRPVPARPPTADARAAALPQRSEAGFRGIQAAPTIEVTIGRIEVRALTPPAPPPAPSRQRQAPPKMSLDDYLRAQGGGKS